MPVADYRCRYCGIILELDTTIGQTIQIDHTDRDDPCPGTLDRIWTPPHTGRGSNGERPK